MQYTLRNIPPNLDEVLRDRARAERKSLNEVVLEALLRAFGLSGRPPRQRDLKDTAGTWKDDAAIEEALRDQRRIDPELWQG